MTRSSLTLLLLSTTAIGCMTEADKAVWMEAKLRFSHDGHTLVKQEAAIPPEGPVSAEIQALKTSQDVPAAEPEAASKKDLLAPKSN